MDPKSIPVQTNSPSADEVTQAQNGASGQCQKRKSSPTECNDTPVLGEDSSNSKKVKAAASPSANEVYVLLNYHSQSLPKLEDSCPYFDLDCNGKGQLVTEAHVNGIKAEFLVDSGSNMGFITHETMVKSGLVDSIIDYETKTLNFIYYQITEKYGKLPPIEIEFPNDIRATAELFVLPEGFKGLNVNILPIQFILAHGCVIDFSGERPRIYFRRTSKDPPRDIPNSNLPYIVVRDNMPMYLLDGHCRYRNHAYFLLDTGGPDNLVNRNFIDLLDENPNDIVSGDFDFVFFRHHKGEKLVARKVEFTGENALPFILGTTFFREFRVIMDFDFAK